MSTIFVVETTSSRGILHYFPNLPVKAYEVRWASVISETMEYKYTDTIYTLEINSVGDILNFLSVGNGEIILGWWFTNTDLVHPDDKETAEYLKTLPFIEIYEDYRE